MREIKFKAFIKHLKWMCEVESIDFINEFVEVDLSAGQGDTSWYSFDEVELIQFTGLRDKNGREVYENDIVRFIDGIGIVKYEEPLACFYITYPFAGDWWNITIPALFTDADSQWLEVMGNTFENPELLEETA